MLELVVGNTFAAHLGRRVPWYRAQAVKDGGVRLSLLGLLVLVVIAAVCGALGQALVGYSVGGWLISSVVGFVGAVFGNWLAGQLGLPTLLAINIDGQPFPIIWSIVGSVILVAMAALFTRRRTVVVKLGID